MSSKWKAKMVVVGAGIGGMAAAARLARDGFDVTVVERNDQAGDGPGFGGRMGMPLTWDPRGI